MDSGNRGGEHGGQELQKPTWLSLQTPPEVALPAEQMPGQDFTTVSPFLRQLIPEKGSNVAARMRIEPR